MSMIKFCWSSSDESGERRCLISTQQKKGKMEMMLCWIYDAYPRNLYLLNRTLWPTDAWVSYQGLLCECECVCVCDCWSLLMNYRIATSLLALHTCSLTNTLTHSIFTLNGLGKCGICHSAEVKPHLLA